MLYNAVRQYLVLAVGASAALEASRSGFDVGVPVYARDVLGGKASTGSMPPCTIGQGTAMLALARSWFVSRPIR